MTVYGYVRVSTGRQAEEGDSLDVQERTIAGYCLMKGMADPVFVREEGVSGSKPVSTRPAGGEMIRGLKSGDVIVAAKLDRMFRSSIDALNVLEQLRKRGVAIHLIDLGGDVSDSMVGKLIFTILSAVAEAERMRTIERIKEVKKDQRGRGRYLGGPAPYGWRWEAQGKDKVLVEHPDEQRAIARVLALREAGATLMSIRDRLLEEGIRASYSTVRRICEGDVGPAAVAAE